jgi:uncharacterized UBP type Zn finger protein
MVYKYQMLNTYIMGYFVKGASFQVDTNYQLYVKLRKESCSSGQRDIYCFVCTGKNQGTNNSDSSNFQKPLYEMYAFTSEIL